MTCVHVLIRLFDCLEGGNTSRFKAAKSIDRLSNIVFSLCLVFLLCNTRYLFRPLPNPFEPRNILFMPRPLYIHALSNIVSLPDAHAFRSQREIIVFRYSRNLVISSACWHRWLVNLAFRNARSCNSWWGLQAFLYVFRTFHIVIFSNIMSKALFARGDLSVT